MSTMNKSVWAIAASGMMIVAAGGCQSSGEQTADAAEGEAASQSVLARDPMVPRRVKLAEPVQSPVAVDAREQAIDLLLQAAGSAEPLLRANAIEALHAAPERLEPAVRSGLGDENQGVRFVAAMMVGRQRLTSLAGLVEPLLADDSMSVRAAAIYALRRCGRKADLNPLAAMIMSADSTVKANAALVLGELGDRSAVPMLREAVGRESPRASRARVRIVDLQIAEAMVKLGQDSQLEVIRAALFAPVEQGEITVLACQMCGQLRDEAYAPSLLDKATREGRRQEPAEIRLAAAEALAQMDPRRAPIEVPLAYVGSDRPELRVQAAATLGSFPADEQVVESVRGLMEDPNPMVQVAAAGAILRLTSR
jgi:HEAT repeat protein